MIKNRLLGSLFFRRNVGLFVPVFTSQMERNVKAKLGMAAVGALVSVGAAMAEDVRHDVGEWSLVERTDDAGKLTCVVTREEGEPRLQLAATADAFKGDVRLAFAQAIVEGPSGSFPGTKVAIDKKEWTVEASWSAIGLSTYVVAPLEHSQGKILPLLSRGSTLTADIQGKSYTVSLKGSGAAIRAYVACLRKLGID